MSKIEGIFYAKPLKRSTDPVFNILDKIDAELNSLSRSQSVSSCISLIYFLLFEGNDIHNSIVPNSSTFS